MKRSINVKFTSDQPKLNQVWFHASLSSFMFWAFKKINVAIWWWIFVFVVKFFIWFEGFLSLIKLKTNNVMGFAVLWNFSLIRACWFWMLAHNYFCIRSEKNEKKTSVIAVLTKNLLNFNFSQSEAEWISLTVDNTFTDNKLSFHLNILLCDEANRDIHGLPFGQILNQLHARVQICKLWRSIYVWSCEFWNDRIC